MMEGFGGIRLTSRWVEGFFSISLLFCKGWSS